MKLYQALSSRLQAVQNCCNSGNEEWKQNHVETIKELAQNHLPSGSGFDSGTEVDVVKHMRIIERWPEASNHNRIHLTTAFHHMDTFGGYSGWSHWRIILTPDLAHGLNIAIICESDDTEGMRYEPEDEDDDEAFGSLVDDGFKDYLHDVFWTALNQEVE